MQQAERNLNISNIGRITEDFYKSMASIGETIQGKIGIPLFIALKREKLIMGPYPNVSIFEAANRIMSDLVILKGITWLLQKNVFPFSSYTVEFGNEDANAFDIQAKAGDVTLIGEAFNVAPSFFQTKKSSALRKLKKDASNSSYRMLMFNNDAVLPSYSPNLEDGFYYILVDVESGLVKIKPNPSLKPITARRDAPA